MTSEPIDYTRLDALLERERAYLLAGDLEGLGKLLPEKEALVQTLLADIDEGRDAITPLEGKLQRNQLLLDGALDGIRAVAARLAALRQVRTTLDTYDAQGRKRSVTPQTNAKVEKRA